MLKCLPHRIASVQNNSGNDDKPTQTQQHHHRSESNTSTTSRVSDKTQLKVVTANITSGHFNRRLPLPHPLVQSRSDEGANRNRFRFKNPLSSKIRKSRKVDSERASAPLSPGEMNLILDSLGLEMENENKVPEATQSTVSDGSHNSLISVDSSDSLQSPHAHDKYHVVETKRAKQRNMDKRWKPNSRRPDIIRSLLDDHSDAAVTPTANNGSSTDQETEEEGTEVTLVSSVRLSLGSPSNSRPGVVRNQPSWSSKVPEQHPLRELGSDDSSSSQENSKPNSDRHKSSAWTRTICSFYSIDDVSNDVAELMGTDAVAAADATDLTGPVSPMGLQLDHSMTHEFALTTPCCKPGCIDDTIVMHRRLTLENRILCLLGGEGTWCDGWHAWFAHVDEETTRLLLPYEVTEPRTLQHVVRNRVGNLHERANRIRMLRQNMGDYTSINEMEEENDATIVRKANSFVEGEYCKDGRMKNRLMTRARSLNERNSKKPVSLTDFLDSVGRCGDRMYHNADTLDEDDLCYDSDPEVTCHRRTSPEVETETETLRSITSQGRSSYVRNPSFESFIDMDVDICMEIMNMRMNLVWHPTPDSYETNHPPVSVRAWVEQGHQLKHTLIQPKFIWINKHEMEGTMSLTNVQHQHLHSVDLLDISRILDVNHVDRKLYPLAKRNTSFIIETFDRKMMFQANSEDMRQRIVHGLKLMVARLGSKIIVNDDSVFEDFFTPTAAAVPGDGAVLKKALK